MMRFLLVGLDGAEPSLVEGWMDEGRLPNLDRLRRNGCYLPLASTMPPASFPAWTTCVTGVNPGRHGIFDFTEISPEPARAVRFVNSTFRKSPALWNVLSNAGKRVCVLGVPATYPPEPVNGCMVSGFDSPVCSRVDRSFVYPADLYGEVRDWRYSDFDETRIGPGWHDEALPRILQKIEEKQRIALRMLGREDWDFFMAVFGESDAVAHHFWLFHDPQSPRHMPSALSGAIRKVYERLDTAVGALINAAGPGAIVAVVSDHGSGGAGTGVIHLNNWLAEHGYLRFSPAHVRVRADSGGWTKRAAMGLVPHRMRGPLFRRFSGMAAAAESGARFAGIDWAHTRAWSEELNYFPSIRIRGLAGRGYDLFCNDLCSELEAWEPVKKAWRRDQLYQGPYVERAPDIVLELNLENGYSYSCLRCARARRGGPAFRRLDPAGYYGGKGQALAGNHRPTGVCFLSQPVTAGAAGIQDIAPTVLAALEVPAPPMDGTSLLGPVRLSGVAEQVVPETPYTSDQQFAVEQRLRALGYFE